ncbi:MAG TPA: aldehyde dehydrogenase family protein, partial [Longimicrobiales bacterium]|nr:aldehyde dehydrogenase family protein [Longimicrobiales bacterium]
MTDPPRRAPDRLFIGGQWVEPKAGGRLVTENPGTGQTLAEVAEADGADVDAAASAARAAFPGWRDTPADQRGQVLWRMADAIAARADELVQLEVLDNGKPIREAQIDINDAAYTFRYYAGWATKIEGETIPVRGRVLNYTLREPVGV